MDGKHYTYRFKPEKEKKLNFTYHPGTNTYTTPPVERKSTLPPKLDDQRHTPEKGGSPIPNTEEYGPPCSLCRGFNHSPKHCYKGEHDINNIMEKMSINPPPTTTR